MTTQTNTPVVGTDQQTGETSRLTLRRLLCWAEYLRCDAARVRERILAGETVQVGLETWRLAH